MTAKKQAEEPAEIPASHEAEAEKDTVGEAKPVRRLSATEVVENILHDVGGSAGVQSYSADGNRITLTVLGPNGLVQTFHATVEEGIREF